jgi:Mrp family chromosome partitioning ATPase
MKLLLASGGIHPIIVEYSVRKIDIVNPNELLLGGILPFIQDGNVTLDAILLTDEAFSQQDGQNKQDLLLLLEWLANQRSNVQLLIITTDRWRARELESVVSRYSQLKILISDYIRVPIAVYKLAFEQLLDQRRGSEPTRNQMPSDKPDLSGGQNAEPAVKKLSFLDRLRPKPKGESAREATDPLTRELEKVSRGMSRVIAVTGHRGSGLTSTAVNVAAEASKRGLSVMIIDMDIDYRSMNMYFNNFHERSKRDEDITASLIRTLARPQDYMSTAYNLKDNLWMTGLGYDYSDRMRLDQFYTSSKLVGLLSVLRGKFNLIILDMPLDRLQRFKESMIHIDVFALCIPNNLHAILSTLKNIEVVLDKESIGYLNAKSRAIITKYNDRARFQGNIFTAENVSKVLSSGLLETFTYEVKVAGLVPYSNEFDAQIEADVALVHTSRDYEHAYGNILLRLLEGAS